MRLKEKRKEITKMSNCLVTLRSPTYAMKAQMLLGRGGIQVIPVKLGGEYAVGGCTHGIRFDCRDRAQVVRILRDNSIPYSKVTQV